MSKNRGIVFIKPGHLEVREIDYLKLSIRNRKCEHGVILKIILSGICGSDLHMLHGRTKVDSGTILGHEITGEVIECGSDVEFIKVGDIVSVPFNVACGRCDNCKELKTNICLNVNPEQPGGAYGYAHMGNWPDGQAEYILVPYADFNLLKLPKEKAMAKAKDLALITDVFPTGFHAAYNAGVEIGAKVYIAGAGPVGLATALSCKLLGASTIILGDVNRRRLELARLNGYETIDLSTTDNLASELQKIVGKPEIEFFIDAVGFEAVGYSSNKTESQPDAVVNSAMQVTKAGGSIGFPGVYVTDDSGAPTANQKKGIFELHWGTTWSKGLNLTMGQTPVMKYNRKLMEAILGGKCNIAQELNVKIVSLDEAVEAYSPFDQGSPTKYFIDPHGMASKS